MSEIDKKDLKQRLDRYVRIMEGYKSSSTDSMMLKMESKRYFEDHFDAEERKYVKAHCPILIRLKLKLMGANIF